MTFCPNDHNCDSTKSQDKKEGTNKEKHFIAERVLLCQEGARVVKAVHPFMLLGLVFTSHCKLFLFLVELYPKLFLVSDKSNFLQHGLQDLPWQSRANRDNDSLQDGIIHELSYKGAWEDNERNENDNKCKPFFLLVRVNWMTKKDAKESVVVGQIEHVIKRRFSRPVISLLQQKAYGHPPWEYLFRDEVDATRAARAPKQHLLRHASVPAPVPLLCVSDRAAY
mmetsp:Transcript_46899/g.84713  ORF Transcript_46899/g.84713 Transcript_46899/m.84713 type:complete len:224 (-) Transcript_46899:679-1350(-)